MSLTAAEPGPAPAWAQAQAQGPASARRTGLPLPGGRALRRRPRIPVGGQTLERIAVHVDLGEAAGDQLIAEVFPARERDIRKEASVTVARVLGRVSAQDHPLRHRELARACGGLEK